MKRGIIGDLRCFRDVLVVEVGRYKKGEGEDSRYKLSEERKWVQMRIRYSDN